MTPQKIEDSLKDLARNIGFHLVGICTVDPNEKVPHLQTWLDRNYHGAMKYMENPKRETLHAVLEDTRTMIVVGLNYRWREEEIREQEGMISKYAWGADYHNVMKPMLEELSEKMKGIIPECQFRAYVDTGPIVEKHWAQKAGLGWIGKHTNILNEEGSSWYFLGVILSNAEMVPDTPAVDRCGTCERCIEACPTRAIVEPYVLDARLCISYLTIELRDSVPRELRSLIGHRIFGCDDCQDVCPWNRFAYVGDPRFTPRKDILSAELAEYLRLTPESFREKFKNTNVLRAKYRGFMRNCLIAAGNLKKPGLRAEIERHLQSQDEMIREHAVWALAQFNDENAMKALQEMRFQETSPGVIQELNHWLS